MPSFVTLDSSGVEEYEYLSEPAKSTKFNVELQFPWFIFSVKITWDLDEVKFRLLESTILFLLHLFINF